MVDEIQHAFVVKQLMRDRVISFEDALNIWMLSKTRAYFMENDLGWVAESRCYWELTLELNNDIRWLREPFGL